ncbi:hypothetical protein [Vibrio sp. HN007]|uniref:hypothetical protein n=1 Tax=Vibrio iocasae TaxID=3098914 RepID=UPI0035D44F62
MKLSRRGWNNVLMLGVIVFMMALNLPNILKGAMEDSEQVSEYPYLMDPNSHPVQVHFSDWSIIKTEAEWSATEELSISASELVQRWKKLVGTEVLASTFDKLKEKLNSANTIEVWYQDIEEPQRITYYETPQFWLMQNWQGKWIAVSVDSEYLFPLK